jgi:hypothetical protein
MSEPGCDVWLSVVICTRDRPGDLDRCLAALAADAADLGGQGIEGIEAIVVDNASSPPVQVRPAELAPLLVRVVTEP